MLQIFFRELLIFQKLIDAGHAGLCRGWTSRRRWLVAAATPASPPSADRACSPLATGDWPPAPRRTRRDRRRRSRRNAGRGGFRTGRRRSCRYHRRNPIPRQWRSIETRAVLCRAWWNNEPKGDRRTVRGFHHLHYALFIVGGLNYDFAIIFSTLDAIGWVLNEKISGKRERKSFSSSKVSMSYTKTYLRMFLTFGTFGIYNGKRGTKFETLSRVNNDLLWWSIVMIYVSAQFELIGPVREMLIHRMRVARCWKLLVILTYTSCYKLLLILSEKVLLPRMEDGKTTRFSSYGTGTFYVLISRPTIRYSSWLDSLTRRNMRSNDIDGYRQSVI